MDHLTMFFRFVVLVWRMRQKQKAYFNDGRKPADLVESKRLERELDGELKRLLSFDEHGEPVGLVVSVEPAVTEPTQKRLI